MNRKGIAAAILLIWFILNGIDLLQDADLIQYSSTEMNKSVDDVLDNFKEALVEIDQTTSIRKRSFFHAYPFYFDVDENLSAPGAPIEGLETDPKLSIKHYKTHKLHQIFLI